MPPFRLPFRPASTMPTVAMNMKPVKGPWGGSSPFVTQLASWLKRLGYRVTYSLDGDVRVIVLIDPRKEGGTKPFGPDEIRAFKANHPEVRVLHRVNECDQRKNTDFMDRMLEEANGLADATVFISEWLLDYHAGRWFDREKPHAVAYNGADSAVFHPVGSTGYDGSGPFRVVTHHWSDNPLKGFDVYERLDGLIAEGKLTDVEFHVIGRWPSGISWRAARTFPPTHGRDLAERLRACHAYITASRWEPCGMHHVEGAQCGLPLLYDEEGGGIVEAGRRYGIGFRGDPADAIARMRDDYALYRRRVLESMPSGERMCLVYGEMIQGLLAGRFEGTETGSSS